MSATMVTVRSFEGPPSTIPRRLRSHPPIAAAVRVAHEGHDAGMRATCALRGPGQAPVLRPYVRHIPQTRAPLAATRRSLPMQLTSIKLDTKPFNLTVTNFTNDSIDEARPKVDAIAKAAGVQVSSYQVS